MPNHTTNYGLTKPLEDEFYDVKDQNENMDKIDFELNRIQEEIWEKPVEAVILKRGENVVEANRNTIVSIESLEGRTEVQLVPPFDSSAWYRKYDTTIIPNPNDARKAELVFRIAGAQTGSGAMPVEGGRSYDVHYDFELPEYSTLKFSVSEYYGDDPLSHTTHIITGASGVFTINTDVATEHISINMTDEQAYTFTINKLLISESGQEPSQVFGIQPIRFPSLNIKDEAGSIISKLSINEHFYEGDRLELVDGNLVKVSDTKEVVLDGNFKWSLQEKGPDWHRVRNFDLTNISDVFNMDFDIVKYSGLLLSKREAPFTKPDQAYAYNKTVSITVSNEDSGWGPNYNPSTADVRAYFFGWRMYDGSSGQVMSGVYNRTDGANKRWAYRDDNGELINSGTGNTVPTFPAPINSKWQPYRIVYKRVRQEIFSVGFSGELLLGKGGNYIELTDGVVIGEYAKPYNGTTSPNVAIINSTYGSESISQLSNRAQKILAIYKNGVKDDSWVIQTTEAFGKERARTELFNPKARYTVDYAIMPIESAKIESITVDYPLNIGSILGEIVTKNAKSMGDISDINKRITNLLSQGESIEWNDLILLNGVETYSEQYRPRYTRIGQFIVIIGALKGITTTTSFTVSVLPKGFRPLQNYGFMKPTTGRNSMGRFARWQIVTSDGSIRLEATTDGASSASDWYPIDTIMIGE